jgi:hypothetical protein
MRLGLGIALNRGAFVGGLDPDAKAYIDAVVADGATVSGAQKKAINTFYETGKSEGWYSSLKRMYFPIWAVEAANANCMVSNTSGTFAAGNTMTHATGYTQGTGTSGNYFEYGTNADALGLSASTGFLFWLSYVAGTAGVQVGSLQSIVNRSSLYSTSSSTATSELTSSGTLVNAVAAGAGVNNSIILSTRTSTTSHKIFHRKNSSWNQRGLTSTSTESTSAPNSMQCAWCRGRSTGTPYDSFSNAGLGAHGIGLGMTDQQAEDFTLALQIMWENCTGLSLP